MRLQGSTLSRALTSGIIFAFAVTACAPSATAPATAAAPTGPQRGGTAVVALDAAPKGLIQLFYRGNPEGVVTGNLFSTLVETDMEMNIKPSLAESWTVSPDGLTYTFQLVPNAKWHDGRPLTAADVEFSMKLWLKDPSFGAFVANLASYGAQGDRTFIVKMKATYGPTLLGLAEHSITMVLPKHVYEVGGDPAWTLADWTKHPANDKAIGSGPFKLKEWVKGQYIELVRNEDYFKPGLPYLDRIVFQVFADSNSRKLAFEKGDIDFLHSYLVPYDRVEAYRKDARFAVVEGGQGAASIDFLLFSLDNRYLKDQRVRKAIAYALDRKDLASKATFNATGPAKSFLGSRLPFYEGKFDAYQLDLTKANQLLDQAGFTRGAEGKRFSLKIDLSVGFDYNDRAAEVIKSQLAAVGIDVTAATADLASFLDRVFVKRTFDMALQFNATGPEPSKAFTPRITKQGIGLAYRNAMGFVNDEVETILGSEFKEVDASRRKASWVRVQEILMDQLPMLPLFEIPNIQLTSSRLHDAVTSGAEGHYSQPRDRAWVTGGK